jgi:excisionase family DNA binding protein
MACAPRRGWCVEIGTKTKIRHVVVYNMISVPEAAHRVGRNPETVRRWIREGKLPARKIGTQFFIEEEELEGLGRSEYMPLPPELRVTMSGKPMPDVLAILRRQRASH